jgi:hypothetical protein
MEHLFWFLVGPTFAGSVCCWHCWKKEHLRFRSSVLIGLGIAAGVLALNAAIITF